MKKGFHFPDKFGYGARRIVDHQVVDVLVEKGADFEVGLSLEGDKIQDELGFGVEMNEQVEFGFQKLIYRPAFGPERPVDLFAAEGREGEATVFVVGIDGAQQVHAFSAQAQRVGIVHHLGLGGVIGGVKKDANGLGGVEVDAFSSCGNRLLERFLQETLVEVFADVLDHSHSINVMMRVPGFVHAAARLPAS